MKIGVPKETASNERRVALVPDAVARLIKTGFEVLVEKGAGAGARLPDDAYRAAGATLVADQTAVLSQADVVLRVGRPTDREVEALRPDAVLVGMLQAAGDGTLVSRLAARRVTAFSLELLPRITRAQPMDVLSSQATVAGYKAVLLAAQASPKFFPMLTTAAGTLPPARVLILGAGVAGLQAIATARRLGAVVSAFDVRPAVKEQVESLGATFLAMEIAEQAEGVGGYAKELSEESHRRELAFIAGHVRDADVVITTALIPGKRAPILVTAEAVRGMKPGSVVVDLAAEQGGNCELTQAGTEMVQGEVTILGPVNLASSLPFHASQMYARNVAAFLQHIAKDGKLTLDFNDEITKATCVAHGGKALRS
jgi:proton-translocating NAD(P)+ transhydrogenase subunit alpha